MTSSLIQAMRNENEIVLAVYNAIEDASSLFSDDVLSLDDIDESAIVAQVA